LPQVSKTFDGLALAYFQSCDKLPQNIDLHAIRHRCPIPRGATETKNGLLGVPQGKRTPQLPANNVANHSHWI